MTKPITAQWGVYLLLFFPMVGWAQAPCEPSPSYRAEQLLGPVRTTTTEAYRVSVDRQQVRDALSFHRTYSSQQCLLTSKYDVYQEGEWRRACTLSYDSISLRLLSKECTDQETTEHWDYQAIPGAEERYEGRSIADPKHPEILQYKDGVLAYKEAYLEPYHLVTHYDQWKRVTRQETYEGDDRELKFLMERTYVQNELIEEVQYVGRNKGINKRLRYEHDFEGRVTTEEMYRRDGSHASSTTYQYNEFGLLLRVEKDYVAPGVEDDSTQYEYDFDEQGNWIERRKILNGRLVNIEKRTLTYYPK